MAAKHTYAPSEASSLYEPLHTPQASEAGTINGPGHHQHDSSAGKPRVSLSFKDLVYEVELPKTKEIKRILNGVSGHVHAGQMMAILGPSGAGKTTMLDILAQRQKGGTVTGELLMNGHPVETGVFRRVSAYVQQEDILHAFLTVKETIDYAGQLRLPKGTTDDDRKAKVSRIMQLLGIDHVKDTKIGGETIRGVSGGEKKRAAIGVELVTDPSLIFLDEPTTGLDTFTALHLLHLLRKLSRQGATVIFSIHQPRSSIFSLFDSVLLLNGHGEEAYFGPAEKAVDFLTTCGVRMSGPDNPADFLLDSVAVVRNTENLNPDDFPFLPPPTQAQDVAAGFRSQKIDDVHHEIDAVKRAYASDSQLPPALDSPYPQNILTQILVVSGRAAVNKLRDPIATFVSIVVSLFFAALVGSIYWQLPRDQTGLHNRLGVLFFLCMNTAFSSLGQLALFMFDRTIYVREHRNGMYSPLAFYLGKVVQDLPISIAITFLFDVVAYFMVGLQADRFGWFYLISILILLNSYTMCLMISCISKDIQVANLIAPVLIVLYLLPSGFLINLNSLPVYWRWVKYISFVRFGFEALVENEMSGLQICDWVNATIPSYNSTLVWNATTQNYGCDLHNNTFVERVWTCSSGNALVDSQLGFKAGTMNENMLYCGISACVYFIIGYLGLRFLRSKEAK